MLSKKKERELRDRINILEDRYHSNHLYRSQQQALEEEKVRQIQGSLIEANQRSEHLDRLITALTTLEPALLDKYTDPGDGTWELEKMQQAINFRTLKSASDEYKGEVVK